MSDPRRTMARTLGGLATLTLVATAAIGGCSQPEGSASFTVTYTPDGATTAVTETITMTPAACDRAGSKLRFGEDTRPDAELAYLRQLESDPAETLGVWLPGAITGNVELDTEYNYDERGVIAVILPDGTQFYSIAPFDADEHGFTLVDHPGEVIDGGIYGDPRTIDSSATVSGPLTC